MDVTFRPATVPERLYCSRQSTQISAQTGYIGHLRGDLGVSGEKINFAWRDYRKDLQPVDFHTELEQVKAALRSEEQLGGILKDLDSLAACYRAHPESCVSPTEGIYAFRADTERHSFLLLVQTKGAIATVMGHCYKHNWLDIHMTSAEQGIRFITPGYRDLFRLTDGDSLRVTYADGETRDVQCRFIDQTHLEFSDRLFHICEFAEWRECNEVTMIPLRASLPETCLSVLEASGELITIRRGEKGYEKAQFPIVGSARETAANLNLAARVTKAQEAAMLVGSMFGWHVPGADPKNYNNNGTPIRPHRHERDGAR